jgi:hypothetical protein
MEETILALLAVFQNYWKNQVKIYKSESSRRDWQQGSLCNNPIIHANESQTAVRFVFQTLRAVCVSFQ